MRGIFVAAVLLVAVLSGGCSEKDYFLKPVKPTDIISEIEAENAIGGEADLVLEHNAVVDAGNNKYRASYLANPVGSADPVIIEVMYPSDTISEHDIEKVYNASYDSRVNKRKIKGVGSNAFVAFPTLNVYEEGHLIRITAGSGDTKQQLDLLLSLGQTAVENLHQYIEKKSK